MLFQHVSFACVVFLLCTATAAQAQINSFNFLQGWTYNQLDLGSASSVGLDFIEITNGSSNRRNVWFNTRQLITDFSATFRYRVSDFRASGISFIIQNDSRGLDAVTNNSGSRGFVGIEQSLALTLQNSTGQTFVGFVPSQSRALGESLGNIRPEGEGLLVNLDYDGRLLDLTISDGVNPTFSDTLIVSPDVASAINSGTAFIGFGGATTSNMGAVTQTISDFRFTINAVPEPSTAALICCCTAAVVALPTRKRVNS